jgi:hypothetical protein
MFSQMWQNKFILGEVPLFGGGVFPESSVNCDGGGGGSGSGVGIVGGGGLLSWEMFTICINLLFLEEGILAKPTLVDLLCREKRRREIRKVGTSVRVANECVGLSLRTTELTFSPEEESRRNFLILLLRRERYRRMFDKILKQ